ncbi:MAG TPA: MOSC domain-containing protein [Acidimicrobiales bacterium]|nr:MOSC domain-containing protein [Acidimicrobiales bacterium]
MTAHPDHVVEVTAVYVGQPRIIGRVRGREVESAIGKSRVEAATIELGLTNLAGDRQADLSVHGGRDMAVYVYPTEHYPAWRQDGFDVDVGGLGENVSLAGTTERQVRLGDVWRWGPAVVQVSQPRAPCFKLALHAGRGDIGPRMIATGRTGWYLRVLEPGTVPTQGPFVLDQRDDEAPSVHELFAVMFRGRDGGGRRRGDDAAAAADAEIVERALRSPALAEAWRPWLAERRAGARR